MKAAAVARQHPRVLVVEDERDVEGYDVIVAPTGADALKGARAARPDVVLLDIMVPS